MREKILTYLSRMDGPPAAPKRIAAEIGEPKQKVVAALRKMANEELVSVSGVVGAGFRYLLSPPQRIIASASGDQFNTAHVSPGE